MSRKLSCYNLSNVRTTFLRGGTSTETRTTACSRKSVKEKMELKEIEEEEEGKVTECVREKDKERDIYSEREERYIRTKRG